MSLALLRATSVIVTRLVKGVRQSSQQRCNFKGDGYIHAYVGLKYWGHLRQRNVITTNIHWYTNLVLFYRLFSYRIPVVIFYLLSIFYL